jgi:Gpi18-like mannosyltransferase
MTIKEKLSHLQFLPNFDDYKDNIDIQQIESFVRQKINYLFQKRTAVAIQDTINNDSHPDIVTFFTYIIELGCIKSVAHNNQEHKLGTKLSEYLHSLVWAYNLILANELMNQHMLNIPNLADGLIYLYFNDNTLLTISDRVEIHLALGNSAGRGKLTLFANLMMDEHLQL